MVTSVNAAALSALLMQEQAAANRAPPPNAPPGAGTETATPDQAVVYAGASTAPSLGGVLALTDGLNKAASISDVGIAAGQAVASLLAVLRDRASAAQTAVSPAERHALDGDYQGALAAIDQLATSASFQGVTMLDGSSGQDLTFPAGLEGGGAISLTPQDLRAGGPVIGLAGTNLLGGPQDLQSLLVQIDQASSAVADRLGQMSVQSDQIQAHLSVVGRLQAALGADQADGAEGARLQALAVQQGLAAQTASVANQAPQAVLSLFRS